MRSHTQEVMKGSPAGSAPRKKQTLSSNISTLAPGLGPGEVVDRAEPENTYWSPAQTPSDKNCFDCFSLNAEDVSLNTLKFIYFLMLSFRWATI